MKDILRGMHMDLAVWCELIQAELDKFTVGDELTMYYIELGTLREQLRQAFKTIDRLRNIKRPAA
jgi:hypothetical protein